MSNTENWAPRYAVLELTNRCNLRCAHCASSSGKARNDELTTAEWLSVLEQMAALGGEEITLIGGEVFMRRDWMDIARHVTSCGMELAIVTNGLLVNDRILDDLRSLDIERIGVSLDGASRETYQAVRGRDGFDQVWSLIERLDASDIAPVNAVTTLSKLNVGELDQFVSLFRSSGITWQVQFAHNVSDRFDDGVMLTPEQYADVCRRLGELLEDPDLALAPMDDFGYFPLDPLASTVHTSWHGCQAGQSVMGIRANGDLLGCLSLGDPFVEGNLRQRSLREIWEDPKSFAQHRNKASRLRGACRTCPVADRCCAGCPAMAYSAGGDIHENAYCLRRVECAELLAKMEIA